MNHARSLVRADKLSTIEVNCTIPRLILQGGEPAARRFIEYFTATIRNPNTRAAYMRVVGSFLDWCEARGINNLSGIEPILVAAYIETRPGATPTVKQHLAAVRMLFDWLVTGHVMHINPAHSVRGPRHVVKRGKTYVLAAEEARQLLPKAQWINL
jgi:integrase/recombinase XerD